MTSQNRAQPAPEEIIRFLKGLRAVRDFRPDPVPPEVIDDILDVFRWSGSASNRQPWEIIVVQDREMLRRLGELEGFAKHLSGAPLGIVLAMSGEPDRVDQETYDEGRLSERIMLAADAYGIGSSIGWWVGQGQTQAKEMLGIPQQRLVRTVISLGYPDFEARRARPKRPEARKPMGEIVYYERYGQQGS